MTHKFASSVVPRLYDNIPNKDALDLGMIFILIGNVIRLLLWFAGVAAIVVVIIAGIMYTTSSGDPARLAKAKAAITNTVIGLILAGSAYSIITLIVGRIVG